MLNNPDCALFWEGEMYKKSNFFGLWKHCHVELHQMELYIRRSSKSASIEKRIFLTDKTKVSLIEKGDSVPWLSISEEGNDDPNENNYFHYNSQLILTADEENTVIQLLVSIRSAYFHNETLSISDFSIQSVIGRGNFGKVTLVKKNETNEYYALKAVHKMKLIETNQVQSALNERNILSQNKHPFIVSLKFAFQSATKFYIGMEFLSGGDLRNYMNKLKYGNTTAQKTISFRDIQIYLAEIGLALDHLHSNGVVYRDLKPENVMIADDGHIKLTDFGLSQDIGKEGSSRSMCGTLEYIAPEIVTNQTYSFSVDWWSLGILAYELIFQRTPFSDENRGRLFAKIVHEDVKFPKDTDDRIKDFIKKLLVKDQEKRFTFEQLKCHPFWDGLNFDEVMQKRHTPQFVPNCGPSVENFNSVYTNEKAFDSFATPPVGEKSVGVNGFSFMGSIDMSSSPESPVLSSKLISEDYDGMEIITC
ncbi:Serine/threonine-protein kinase AtPK1/AtPK6 [Tritrichomonas foetus]|uniref:Serine/threonine-protein kinase AtPK1/AtPK6 n=1 Tax=Tritrichomonas foetus TaxID=1144522 RepID=A0A1J4JL76_9EUKA|nr:Serine/threonine-protein kinase AtPK1/AtPK6 [Tritrichomonas foetus]|eukprot:OHS98020.1 Serine/threonine-protein kinase AtPK1/AtPK6 [Tritrichomonas foetus]